MGSIYKRFTSNDKANTTTIVNEAIPITGSIVSGSTYDDDNIKNFTHGMFQTVYDYPYLSSSANEVVSITTGYSPNSSLSSSSNTQNSKKINIYNEFAKVLVGQDITGSILEFDQDGNILAGGTKHREVFFLNFSRLLVKDEIKKGSFSLTIAEQGGTGSVSDAVAITDAGAANDFKVNSPSGEYGLLVSGSTNVGAVYYQAGVAVLTASVFSAATDFGPDGSDTGGDVDAALTSQNIEYFADGVRNRWVDLDFNNATEINSTVYFCRINNNEFNYSSNSTYLSASQIRVKETQTDQPVTYITAIGLYSADNELMAVAKLSEPLKKTPSIDHNIRVRIDY